MVLSSIQKTISSKHKQRQTINAWSTKQSMLPKNALLVSLFSTMLSLSACQNMPTTQASSTASTTSGTNISGTTTVTEMPAIDSNNYQRDYPVEVYIPTDRPSTASPYPTQPIAPPVTSTSDNSTSTQNPLTQQPSTQSATTTQQLPDILSNNNSSVVIPVPDIIVTTPSPSDYMISPPTIPPRNELLERARQNSQQQSKQSTTNNSELPAFRNLMQSGTSQLKAGNLTAAENSFTRAQRIAPKSSAVYFYLAQVALKKNQPRKAEAMARRGLSVSQEASRRRALWQLILQSGQLQNNSRVVREAKQALR